jgi:hypothetical protein
MKFRTSMAVALFAVMLAADAHADGFRNVAFPTFSDIEPRLVYGTAQYDVSFTGNGPQTRGESAKRFLADIVKSKFSSSKGNYIVTLNVALDGKTIVTEPIISANWENEKFLFITTSEKQTLVINRVGVLLDDFVVDNATNRVSLSLKVLFSNNSSVDLSLFKAISDLSKTAAVASLAPGAAGLAEAFQPFETILAQLLTNYKEVTLVENTVGAFTLLHEGFANQLNFKNNQFSLNIYLKTENSQLPRNFDVEHGKFKETTSSDSVLATVSSGTGALRKTVLDIIREDDDPGSDDLKAFVNAVRKATPLPGGFATAVRPQCAALKAKLNTLVTTRDTSLVYWAFLKMFGTEILKYSDGKSCGDPSLTESLTQVGLVLGPEWHN